MRLTRKYALLGATTGTMCGVYAALQVGAWGFGRHQQIYEVAPGTSSLLERVILTGDEAYLVLPAEPVSGPATYRSLWPSPDGNFLLVSRFKEFVPDSQWLGKEIPTDDYDMNPGEHTLAVWDSEKRQATLLWRGVTNEKQWAIATPLGFFHQTGMAVALVATVARTPGASFYDRKQNTLVAFDVQRGTSRTLAQVSPQANLLLCPFAPKMAVLDSNDTVQIVHSTGGQRPLVWAGGGARQGTVTSAFA